MTWFLTRSSVIMCKACLLHLFIFAVKNAERIVITTVLVVMD